MIEPNQLFSHLQDSDITFFSGVPDSLLKDFCAYITDHSSPENHIIAANEGNAIAVAAGHYLATGRLGLVYLQNSGLGNAINPLVSLCDPAVYGIPMLLLVGWRGAPREKDEPQHEQQGKITAQLLDLMEIPWMAIDESTTDCASLISEAVSVARNDGRPAAILVKKRAFFSYGLSGVEEQGGLMSRESALRCITGCLRQSDIIVAGTGMIARELYEINRSGGSGDNRDFLTVGSMGHASSISLGIAVSRRKERVICVEGDGSALMHLGALSVIGQVAPPNFIHIVLNNQAHDSVGGQPTAAGTSDLHGIAGSCGYADAKTVSTREEIRRELGAASRHKGPTLLEVKTKRGHRSDLGRPKTSPKENREAFMKTIGAGQSL